MSLKYCLRSKKRSASCLVVGVPTCEAEEWFLDCGQEVE
ncbi:hypothetical protein L195_g005431 [Trifolium pratense]|uniref:Uncharacterized protein n=1 Tax=Trifolium pratense TaxID=57577 RepID=A0A2K3P0X6_TRIPR|nr:hypothetical protein L195_g021941 [Trifolium pratense]PNY03075.1 hypothetical protein L195_g026398 [Trifolium pratense]PNY08893.1 hypothetical protein L195_g005431 [Trifolium pratense]